ncbi:MAG: hypothetical protein ATN35_07735 [Epulopiscium sp. Nele67-Bin004]|nr:MAG: hypothetical protein ATN35_07735 [Epulopiscium sp. Nele67-Bin004]
MSKYLLKLSLILVVCLLTSCNSGVGTVPENAEQFNMYYFSTVENDIIPQQVIINLEENIDKKDYILTVIDTLYRLGNGMIVPISLNVDLSNDIVSIILDEEYTFMSTQDQIVLRASLIYTLTELDFVEGIEFFVGENSLTNNIGVVMGVMDRSNVGIGAFNPNPATNYQTVVLYFRDEELDLLVAEKREIKINKDVPIEGYIMEELVKGPETEGLIPTLPSGTTINYIETKDNVCQVDLSYDRQAKEVLTDIGEELFVYSIVNSLTEIYKIEKVSFLIDGQRPEGSAGLMDFGVTFERNETIVVD